MGEKVAMVQNWFSGMKSSLDYMLDNTLCVSTLSFGRSELDGRAIAQSELLELR